MSGMEYERQHLALPAAHRYPVLPECLNPGELENEDGGGEGDVWMSDEGLSDDDGGEDDAGVMDRQLPMLVLPLYSLLSSEQQAKVCTPLGVGRL